MVNWSSGVDNNCGTRANLMHWLKLKTVMRAYPETLSFVRGGPGLTTFFFVDDGCESVQIPLKAGNHRPVSERPLNAWGLMMAQH